MVPVRGQLATILELLGVLGTISRAIPVGWGGNSLGAILSPMSSGDGKGISLAI